MNSHLKINALVPQRTICYYRLKYNYFIESIAYAFVLIGASCKRRELAIVCKFQWVVRNYLNICLYLFNYILYLSVFSFARVFCV